MKTLSLITGAAVAAISLFAASSAHAQGFKTTERYWSMEDAPNDGWFFGGHAGTDYGAGFAHTGQNNLWINNWTKNLWNSVNVTFAPQSGSWGGNTTTCDITAWVQTSPNFDGSIAVWNLHNDGSLGGQLGGQRIFAHSSYTQIEMDAVDVTAATGTVLMDLGFWGTGTPQWIRVDDVHVVCWNFNAPKN